MKQEFRVRLNQKEDGDCMEFKKVSLDEYKQYYEQYQGEAFYTQMPYYADIIEEIEHSQDYFVLLNDGKVRALASIRLLQYHKIFQTANVTFGPAFNQKDTEAFKIIMKNLVSFYKKNKRVVAFIYSGDYVTERYDDIEFVEKTTSGQKLNHILTDIGFTKLKSTAYEDPRLDIEYIYVKEIKDMTFDALFKSFRPELRNQMRRARRNGIQVREASFDDQETIEAMRDDTVAKTGETPAKISRYLKMNKMAPEHVFLPFAYIKVDESLEQIAEEERKNNEEREKLAEKFEGRLNAKKYKNQINQLDDVLRGIQKRQKEMREMGETHGNLIPLAYSVYLRTTNRLIHLNAGTFQDFNHLNPMMAIHEKMFKKACDLKLDYYDFFGMTGDTSEEAEDYGVLQFKRSFDGEMVRLGGNWQLAYNFLYTTMPD